MTGSSVATLPAVKPRARIVSVDGTRATRLIVDRAHAAKYYGPAALPKPSTLPKLLPPRGSKADRRRRATAAEIRADRGRLVGEEWARSSGLQVLAASSDAFSRFSASSLMSAAHCLKLALTS